MNSMTGFGRGRAAGSAGSLDFTLSCINKKGLEISIGLPRELGFLEGELFELLRKSFERGKLQLTGRWEPVPTEQSPVKKRFAELKKVCKELKVEFAPSAELVSHLMHQNTAAVGSLPASVATTAAAAAQKAIAACQKAQAEEGKRLQVDIASRIKIIAELAARASALCAGTLPAQRERLLKNLKDAGLTIDINDERVLKELALFADRVDVSEEITRIGSHLKAAEKLLTQTTPMGRPLEFLLQELLREWNTLGNKSPQIELVKVALTAKNEVERLREQAANIS